MDVKLVFLYSDIDEEVYIELPEGWNLFPNIFPDVFQLGEIVLIL
jgi:hypothetical protein